MSGAGLCLALALAPVSPPVASLSSLHSISAALPAPFKPRRVHVRALQGRGREFVLAVRAREGRERFQVNTVCGGVCVSGVGEWVCTCTRCFCTVCRVERCITWHVCLPRP